MSTERKGRGYKAKPVKKKDVHAVFFMRMYQDSTGGAKPKAKRKYKYESRIMKKKP